MFFFLLVLISSSRGVFSLKSFVPTTIRLQDTLTNGSFYICTYGSLEPTSATHIPASIIIDVRDLQAENMTLSAATKEARNRTAYVNEQFTQAEVFSFLMLEDRTGAYKLASEMAITVVLAVTDDIRRIVKPDVEFNARVYFVPRNDFQTMLNQMKTETPSGLLMNFSQPPPPLKGYGILAFVVLKLLSVMSIITAGLIVTKNHEELLLLVHSTRPDSRTHPFVRAAVPALFILCVIALLLLSYFLFDIMVYFFIGVFVVAGASAMSFFIITFLIMKAPALKRLAFRIAIFDVNILRCVLFFAFLAFTITWCVFRNDPLIGWIMQDIIGVFLVIQVLVDASIFISFKTISLGFLILMLYDVFFVFISPHIIKSSPVSENQPRLTSDSPAILSRGLRAISPPRTSIMEAVATGSAGSSGELMPLVFKISLAAFHNRASACYNNRDYVILGFGDAILPGVLCVFLAFYDACWKRKVPWNFICSLIGYVLGGLIVSTVLFNTEMGQPALLYLCPLTLGTTVLCAYLRDGIAEIHSLWAGNLPTPPLLLNDNIGDVGGDGGVSGTVYHLLDEKGVGSSSAEKKTVNEILPESTKSSTVSADCKESVCYRDRHVSI